MLIALDGTDDGDRIVHQVASLLPGGAVRLLLYSVAQSALVSGVRLPAALRVPGARRAGLAHLEAIAQRLRRGGHVVSVRVDDGTDVGRQILDAAREEGVDLIAMATHGRQGLRRLGRGSVADRVVRSLPTPVLLLHPGDWSDPAGAPGTA